MEKLKKNSDTSCCRKSKLAVVCYIISALLLIAAVYMLVVNVRYLSSYAQMYGMSLADMTGDLIQYSVSAFVPYFTYAVLVFCMGRIMQFICCVSESARTCCMPEAAAEGESCEAEAVCAPVAAEEPEEADVPAEEGQTAGETETDREEAE